MATPCTKALDGEGGGHGEKLIARKHYQVLGSLPMTAMTVNRGSVTDVTVPSKRHARAERAKKPRDTLVCIKKIAMRYKRRE